MKTGGTKAKGERAGELPVVEFASASAWAEWLAQHHTRDAGVWLRFYKKASGVPSVNYAEALDAALCYGWIDGQLKNLDERSYLQRFTPRRARSIWSRRNIEHVERLTRAGRMQPAGLAQVAAAQKDGRWQRAYDPPSAMTVPEDFLDAVRKDAKAYAFFRTLNKTNLYAIGWRLHHAKKPETRARRMQAIIEMLAQGQAFHPAKSRRS